MIRLLLRRISANHGLSWTLSRSCTGRGPRPPAAWMRSGTLTSRQRLLEPHCQYALIADGSSALGMAAASHFLAAGGLRVILLGEDPSKGTRAMEQIIENHGAHTAVFIPADVTRQKSYETAFRKALEEVPYINVVFNNLDLEDESDCWNSISMNLNAVVAGSFAGLRFMGKKAGRPGGVIVNLSSMLALQDMPAAPIYCASKAAVVGLTRTLGGAFHFNRTGIRIVAICPSVSQELLASCTSLGEVPCRRDSFVDKSMFYFPTRDIGHISQAFLKLAMYGPSGSVWTAHGDVFRPVNFPSRHSMMELEVDFSGDYTLSSKFMGFIKKFTGEDKVPRRKRK